MYTGILDVRGQSTLDVFNLLIASDELLLEGLTNFIQKYLIEEQNGWLQRNLVKVHQIVFQLESCKKLQDYCLECICDDPIPFFKLPEFPTLQKSILLDLIKGDLQIDEIDLWNHLIRWGIAQNSELSLMDLSNWNVEDFLALKYILNPFIPYIRFFEISSKDFHNQVRPYKKVLPEELFESVLSFYMTNSRPRDILPPRYGKIAVNSKIITPKHAAILANWIQRKHANAIIPKDHRYNMNLIYRGNRDGFDINAIRNKCNGQVGCILIIKIVGGTVIGGYNPLGWKAYGSNIATFNRNNDNNNMNNTRRSNNNNIYRGSTYRSNSNNNNNTFRNNNDRDLDYTNSVANNYWVNNNECFLFSMGNRDDLRNVKISRVEHSAYAMYESNCYNQILNFGNGDLVVNNKKGRCQQKYYESRILDISEFDIEEMEIFAFSIQKFVVARMFESLSSYFKN
ncbi:7133_t:CDS:1 [Funneliformis geosporum]|uniref:7133_t:CDS:1 n=1 Tax=Funneliformis geosporum TaxID=1117311 RepID=A0A9W4WMP7_9GLOM|nr:7133_t:CDS:1 [Funneliformis geosporum]